MSIHGGRELSLLELAFHWQRKTEEAERKHGRHSTIYKDAHATKLFYDDALMKYRIKPIQESKEV